MAEQKAVAAFLNNSEAVNSFLVHIRSELSYRLTHIFNGFQALRQKGFNVDAIAPQAAIYLTVNINLVGKTTAEGNSILTQAEVTDYILNEAKLALVPFYAFGADKSSTWYRLSVGCVKKEEIPTMLAKLEQALEKLS
jgi:aspartate aminotransferase